MTLPREEYVEQAYLFRTLCERISDGIPMQDLLMQVHHEMLATTKLPMAISFLATELKHRGVMAVGMQQLGHYFSPWQAFLVAESESDRGRFDTQMAFRILQGEAEYRSTHDNPQGLFFYQFEAMCRNRLNYDRGLKAMSEDAGYDAGWQEWILVVRRQLGLVDLADLIYGRSQAFVQYRQNRIGIDSLPLDYAILFGDKEGRIAYANRRKDILYLFAAMQRHLGYPAVPRPVIVVDPVDQIPQLQRRLERLESRIQIMEEERRQGLDISKFYEKGNP
jgi:hypothetical protein